MDARSTIFGLAGSGLMALLSWGRVSLVVAVIGSLVIVAFLSILLAKVKRIEEQTKSLGENVDRLNSKVEDVKRAVTGDG